MTWWIDLGSAIGALVQGGAGVASYRLVKGLAKREDQRSRELAEQTTRQAKDDADRVSREAEERSRREIEAARTLSHLERVDATQDEAIRSVIRHVNELILQATRLDEARKDLSDTSRRTELRHIEHMASEHDAALLRINALLVELAVDSYLVDRAWAEEIGEPLIAALRSAINTGHGVVTAEATPDQLRECHRDIHSLLDLLPRALRVDGKAQS